MLAYFKMIQNDRKGKEFSLNTSEEASIKEILEWAERTAAKKGWRVNPNETASQATLKGLLANQRMYGRRYCPCRRVTRNPEKDKAIICPCIYSADELEQDGICLCELFVNG